MFTVLASIGIGYLVWYEITQRTEDTVYDTIMNITLGLGPIAIGAAAIGVIITGGTAVQYGYGRILCKEGTGTLHRKDSRKASQTST
jgi:hypothetical protein